MPCKVGSGWRADQRCLPATSSTGEHERGLAAPPPLAADTGHASGGAASAPSARPVEFDVEIPALHAIAEQEEGVSKGRSIGLHTMGLACIGGTRLPFTSRYTGYSEL